MSEALSEWAKRRAEKHTRRERLEQEAKTAFDEGFGGFWTALKDELAGALSAFTDAGIDYGGAEWGLEEKKENRVEITCNFSCQATLTLDWHDYKIVVERWLENWEHPESAELHRDEFCLRMGRAKTMKAYATRSTGMNTQQLAKRILKTLLR